MENNIFKIIREDHDVHRKLLDELVETEGNTEKRKRLYLQIKHELAIHADAEERYFYVPLFDDNMTQKQARHGVAEHHQLDKIIKELDDTEMESAGWLVAAKKLKHKMYHHLEEEEQHFFQTAGKILNETQKQNLAKQYRAYISDKRVVNLEA